ncbi:MAG: hypothetical protein H6767_04160 [Candidatus Peribacteria bacterium]|nr:MAG: hypothetical protein H6767_04160 [Candidatus Peribacteria bacterium]
MFEKRVDTFYNPSPCGYFLWKRKIFFFYLGLGVINYILFIFYNYICILTKISPLGIFLEETIVDTSVVIQRLKIYNPKIEINIVFYGKGSKVESICRCEKTQAKSPSMLTGSFSDSEELKYKSSHNTNEP